MSKATGAYDSADAGARTVTALLSLGDYSLSAGTLASNYILPTTATGAGQIDRRALTATIINNPTRVYDGATGATLAAANYSLTGFIAGQGATVTKTSGAYDSANAGSRSVTTSLAAGDISAAEGTNLSNYVLPTTASGVGTINPKALTATITGNPTKVYDGTTGATLNAGNFVLTGLVGGETISVTRTAGAYDSAEPGVRTVTVNLAAGDFSAGAGASLSNYLLPGGASGSGTIERASTGDPVKDILLGLGVPEPEAGATAQQAAFAGGTPRVYIPFPAPGALSTLRNNGMATLPVILEGQVGRTATGLQQGLATVQGGAPVINVLDSILLQGARSKSWTIFVPMAPGAPAASEPEPGDK